jgi:hypothetical protein
MSVDRPSFNRGAVRPVECIKAGWRLIKDEYWLFLGITLVAVIIASVVPLGILAGPMFVGLHLCLLRKLRRQTVSFETLFKGFEQFVQSLIATLIMMVPAIVLIVPAYIILIVAVISSAPQPAPGGGPPPPGAPGTMLGAMGLFYVYLFVVIIVLQVFFLYAYPLLADRKVSGVEAVKMSVQAAMANFGGTLGLVLLNFLLSMVGTLACCIGTIFLMPITYAATMIAYRQAFGADDEPLPDDRDPNQLDYDEARNPDRRPPEA